MPGFILLIFVVVFPLLFAVSLAFTNYDLYHSPPRHLVDWAGFYNFIQLVTVPVWNQSFMNVLSWTLVWTVVEDDAANRLGVIAGGAGERQAHSLQAADPHDPDIAVGNSELCDDHDFFPLFNDRFGAINRMLRDWFQLAPIPWLIDPLFTKIALIGIQVWLGIPFMLALFTGVLQSISHDAYEAADVDGGTDILISWVYQLTFKTNNYNMAATISLINGVIVIAFAFFQFRRTKSFKEERDH